MKRALTMLLALTLSLPLLAAEQKEASKPKSDEVKAAEPQLDSPMVQAMKRANRQGRPTAKVITNETIKASKGHVTTTTVQRSVNVPEPELTPTELAAKNAAERRQQEQKSRIIGASEAQKAAAEKERRIAERASRSEEGLYEGLDDDPAQAEHEADEASQDQPQKPPQN